MSKDEILFKLLPAPKSRFITVKCLKCGNQQVTFSHASARVHCKVCGEVLLEPTGGKARVEGEVVGALE